MAARHAHARTPALFVYGSLLNRENWKSVLGAAGARAITLTPARLRGWRRNWNGVGHSYGGMVLNLTRDAGAAMWGAIVRGLSAETWALLDEQEHSHLPRSRVLVVTARGRRVYRRVRSPASDFYSSTHRAMKRFVSCAFGSARFEDQMIQRPSGLKCGKPSKPGDVVTRSGSPPRLSTM